MDLIENNDLQINYSKKPDLKESGFSFMYAFYLIYFKANQRFLNSILIGVKPIIKDGKFQS